MSDVTLVSPAPQSSGSAVVDGFTVTSSTETSEQISQNLAKPKEEASGEEKSVDPSEAAKVLGKKGGEAAAAKRAEARAAETPEESGELAEEGEDKPLGKPRNDPRARMLQATQQAAEAKRRAAQLEADLQIERAERARLLEEFNAKRAGKEAPVERDPDVRPKAEDFEQYEDFVEALADWKADQKLSKFRQEQEIERESQTIFKNMDRALSTSAKAMREFKASNPDFTERLAPEVAEMKVSFARVEGEPFTTDNVIADEVVFSGAKGPALMLHLSEHPEELQRLRALRTPQDVQVEMRLLSRTLGAATAGTASPKVSVSKAPPPVRPVTGTPHSTEEPDAEGSFEDYARVRMPQLRRQAR